MPEPSPFYRQHHEVEAPLVDARHFRPGWKVITRLDGLLADGWISAAEFHTAATFREIYDEAQPPSARSTLAGLVTGGSRATLPEPLPYRLDASKRLMLIQFALGRRRYAWLILSVIEDTPWKVLGRRWRIDHRTARKRVAGAIKQLTRLDSLM
jgi:hypothetical protein